METISLFIDLFTLGIALWTCRIAYDLRDDFYAYRYSQRDRWRRLAKALRAAAAPDELQETANPVILSEEPAAALPISPPPVKSEENKETLQPRTQPAPITRARRRGDDEIKKKLGLMANQIVVVREEGE